MAPNTSENAYATLITRPSYLAGAIILAYTLHQHSPSTPLIILYTANTLTKPCVTALESESRHTNLILHPIDPLLPPNTSPKDLIAERFADTWTKLRVFDTYSLGFKKICFLDADMAVFKDPSKIAFETELSGDDWILATHACVCNLDNDKWAPADWKPENCAYTGLTHSSSLETPPPVKKEGTHSLLNSGMFTFRPTKELWEDMLHTFQTEREDTLRSYKFPDQDFLTAFFRGKWKSVPWCINALKTWRYWHPNMWRDDEVQILHYIVDKPWAARVGEDGKAGYKGDDGPTHSWWWERYERWRGERLEQGEEEEVKVVDMFVASQDGSEREELRAVGSQTQAFARNRSEEGTKKEEEHGEGDHVHIPRPVKMLGERGHGPVVRGLGRGHLAGRGRSYMEP